MGTNERWKRVLEEKGPRMNVEKTKGMQLLCDKAYVLKMDLYGVCGERVGHNSTEPTKFQERDYYCRSDVSGWVNLLSCHYVFV